jgi:uncharacterized protein YjbI with pentapeptide repeats
MLNSEPQPQPQPDAPALQSSPVPAREPPWWVRDIILAVLIGAGLLGMQAYVESRAADRAERRENLRYVREHTTTGNTLSFIGIDLREANLSGLVFDNADFTDAQLSDTEWRLSFFEGSTNFRGADLTGATFHTSFAEGVSFEGANLSGSLFLDTRLVDASFKYADLRGAEFSGADMRGADLAGKEISDATFERVCWDGSTSWPDGFTPPPSDRTSCR